MIFAVAPFAGAWIEIAYTRPKNEIPESSLPSRERGLKFRQNGADMGGKRVAPFAGAWIEILSDKIGHALF